MKCKYSEKELRICAIVEGVISKPWSQGLNRHLMLSDHKQITYIKKKKTYPHFSNKIKAV